VRVEGPGNAGARDELTKIAAELRHKGEEAARLVTSAGKVVGKAAGEFVLETAIRLLSDGDDTDSPPERSRKRGSSR